MPPLAERLAVYACPTVAAGRVVVERETAGALIVIRSCRVAVWFVASVTVAVKSDTPAVVGVPEIAPLLGFKVSAVGNDPADIDQA